MGVETLLGRRLPEWEARNLFRKLGGGRPCFCCVLPGLGRLADGAEANCCSATSPLVTMVDFTTWWKRTHDVSKFELSDAMKAMALAPVAEAEMIEEEDLENPETLALPTAQSVSDLTALSSPPSPSPSPPLPYHHSTLGGGHGGHGISAASQQPAHAQPPGSTYTPPVGHHHVQPQHVPPASHPPQQQHQQQLRVKVPWGVFPGQLINVKAPNGHSLQCTVPPGLQPGQHMLVNMPTGPPPPLTTIAPPLMHHMQVHRPPPLQQMHVPIASPMLMPQQQQQQQQAWGGP